MNHKPCCLSSSKPALVISVLSSWRFFCKTTRSHVSPIPKVIMSGKIFGALLFRFPSPPASRILSFAAVLPMRRRRRRRRRRCRQRRRTQFANFCTQKRRLSSQTFTLLLLASTTGLSLFLCVSLHLCVLCVGVYMCT